MNPNTKDPKTLADPERSRTPEASEPRARKPYAAPAIVEEVALKAVTLGTMPPVNPKQGC